MEALLKLSAVIALFYLCYSLFLKKETFFQANRWFFNIGILIAMVTPFVVIPIYKTIQIPMTIAESTAVLDPAVMNSSSIAETFNWSQFLIAIYLIGVLVFGIQFLFRLGSLLFLIISNPKYKSGNCIIVEVNEKVSPFSFFNYIVINRSQFNPEDLNHILEHEKAHASQWHSIDILLSHLLIVINWFNPFAWFLKKTMEQNLEFIADAEALKTAECEKNYQKLILRSTVPNYQLVLANNFYDSLIKKRIIMIHKDRSRRINQLKMLSVLPLLAFFFMSFATKEIVSYEPVKTASTLDLKLADQDKMMVVVTKETSDEELDKITEKMKANGITLKFKGVKRNSDGHITEISISAKTDNANANYQINEEEGIDPLPIKISDKGISIGDGERRIHDHDYHFESKDGKHKVHKKKGSGSNVFYFKSDDEEHDGEHEIIEHKDKIIIKGGGEGKVKIEESEDVNTYVIVEEIEEGDDDKKGKKIKRIKTNGEGKGLMEFKERKSKDGKGVKIEKIKRKPGSKVEVIVKKDKDGNYTKEVIDEDEDVIWIEKDGDDDGGSIFELKEGDGKNLFFFSGEDGKDPLVIIDGKESTREEMNKLDKDQIATINVMKGKAATKKYGEKGKDGVIEITKKKN